MNEVTFEAREDRALAHTLHLLALTEAAAAFTPGYARADQRLRAASRTAAAPAAGAVLPEFASVLAGERAEARRDAEWFGRRWDAGGESGASRAEAERIAAEASATPNGGLLSGLRVAVTASTALRPGVWSLRRNGDAASVLVGHGTPGALLVLGAIAARLPLDASLAPLSFDDAHAVRLHCAGSVLAAALGEGPEIGQVLEAVVDVLLPPQHQGQRVLDLIARFRAAGLFDQPPGEIERLGQGLARRYPDRLHRAWLRGFFVPRGLDARAWLAPLRGA